MEIIRIIHGCEGMNIEHGLWIEHYLNYYIIVLFIWTEWGINGREKKMERNYLQTN